MKNLCVVSVLPVFLSVSQATLISWTYSAKLEFYNKKSNKELLGEYNSRSLFKCAVFCQKDCEFFGYNAVIKRCRVHQKIFTSGMSDEPGWRYYSINTFSLDCKNRRQNTHNNSVVPLHCENLRKNSNITTGVYEIYPFGANSCPIRVYCDMETMDGGWTAIQKRIDGSLDFEKNWTEYKNGFGAPEDNIWIGNDIIHQLKKGNNSSLYISITLENGDRFYELYDRFSVSNEADNYKLFLAGPTTGTLGDSMIDSGSSSTDLSGMAFTTPDRDNDGLDLLNCAGRLGGGWWFNGCHHAFLNGPWSTADWKKPWYPKINSGEAIKETLMMIKLY